MLRSMLALLLICVATAGAADAQSRRTPPYWASIASGQAMMRTGPGRNYPATWLYVRRDLPVRVLEVYQSWRKIQDPDGTTGWMLVNLLSDTRTGIVRGAEPAPLHEEPNAGSPLRFRAEPGVVGRISDCEGGWCRFENSGRSGYIPVTALWGVEVQEVVD